MWSLVIGFLFGLSLAWVSSSCRLIFVTASGLIFIVLVWGYMEGVNLQDAITNLPEVFASLPGRLVMLTGAVLGLVIGGLARVVVERISPR